jgi:hypothetical protein
LFLILREFFCVNFRFFDKDFGHIQLTSLRKEDMPDASNGFLPEERNESLAWCQGDVGLTAGGDEAVCQATVGEFHADGGESPSWLSSLPEQC